MIPFTSGFFKQKNEADHFDLSGASSSQKLLECLFSSSKLEKTGKIQYWITL